MPDSPTTQTDEWLTLRDLPALLALTLAGFALLAPSLWPVSPAVVGYPGSDVAREYFGSRTFAYSALARGIFPFWNPHLFGGTPYFANPQSALLYPLNYIFLILPVWAAINATMALHLGLAASGTYLFSRSMGMSRLPAALAGVAFGWSAHMVLSVYNGSLSNVCTIPWIPISLAALERTLTGHRRGLAAVALAWAVALMVLAGHIQYAVFGMVGMVIYGGVRLVQTAKNRDAALRAVGRIAVAGVLAAALVAVQVVPTLELLNDSVRQAVDARAWVRWFHLPPENLVTLIVPDLFGNQLRSTYWGRFFYGGNILYVGLIPLGLAALALLRRPSRSVTALVVMGGTALLLALDGAIPGIAELFAALPGFRAFRGYAKFVALLSLALAVLAGWGLESWMTEHYKRPTEGRSRPRTRLFGAGLFVIAIAAALVLWLRTEVPTQTWAAIVQKAYVPGESAFIPPSIYKTFLEKTYTVARLGVVRTLVVLATCGIVLFLSNLRAVRTRGLGYLVILVAVADLAAFGLPYGRAVNPLPRFTLEPRVVFYLKERIGSGRIMTVADPFLNRPLSHGLAFFGGRDTLILDRFVAYFNKAQGTPVNQVLLSLEPRNLTRLADLYAVSYILGPANARLEHPNLVQVLKGRRHTVYRNLAALPRALISGRVDIVEERETILEKLAEPDYDPRISLYTTPDVVAPGQKLPVSKRAGLSGATELTLDTPNKVVIETILQEDGYLYLADPAYPGWRVEVDGRPSRWFVANVCCRAVALPAGRHRVVFTFRPRGFIPLAALASVAWLGSLVAAVVLLRRPPTSGEPLPVPELGSERP